MMTGNKGTFSAGSMAQGPRGPRRPTGQQKRSSSNSLGYPTIEGLLESEDFSGLEEGFEDIRKQVTEIVTTTGHSPRDRKRAKSAISAFERALELLNELLEIKAQMKK